MTSDTKPEDAVEVIQADRDAAEAFMDAHGWLCEERWQDLFPEDQKLIARDFARHRLATSPTPAPVAMQEGEVERMARAISEARYSPPWTDSEWKERFEVSTRLAAEFGDKYALPEFKEARAILTALRASSPVGEG